MNWRQLDATAFFWIASGTACCLIAGEKIYRWCALDQWSATQPYVAVIAIAIMGVVFAESGWQDLLHPRR